LTVHWLRRYLWPSGQWRLVAMLARRELASRFRGSLLGGAWFVLGPLLLLLIYTLVLRDVMQVRWPGGDAAPGRLEFALRLLCGLALYQCLADALVRSSTLVTSQPQLVKKVAFPLELLAWVNTAVVGAAFAVSAAFLVLGASWAAGGPPLSLLALPLIWLPLLPLLLGLAWLLSGLGTYIRDVTQLLPPIVSLLMFLSPVFYPLEALPAWLRPWMAANPIALPITQTRRVLLEGAWPDWPALAAHALACVAIAVVGAAWFHRVRKGFADVV
jgi:lipopolysaccharide transport system permease protein